MINKKVCFFSTVPLEKLKSENYSMLDIQILKDLGFDVVIASRFSEIPNDVLFYYSWWASGSFLPLIKSILFKIPIYCIAGGNEATLYKDSISKKPYGYLNANFLKKIATRLTLKFSDNVIVVSEFMINDVKKLGANKPILIHNCVKIEENINYNNNKKYITTIFRTNKRIVELKRGEIFIRAAINVLKIYSDEKFLIIGEKGDDYYRLQNLINEYGYTDSFIFTGEIETEAVKNLLLQSKIYIQISDTETFGMSIVEAMSYFIPVIVSKRGAIPEIVGDYGIYVDHNSIDSVTDAIKHVLNFDSKKLKNITNNNFNRVKNNYSYEIRKKKISNLLNIYIND
jgi:glycosyltransferase involved in cell wall biosynthesis